jgi:hypothetical protein
MLRVDGWSHDAWGANGMLFTEALVGVGALAVFVAVVTRVRGATLVLDGENSVNDNAVPQAPGYF